MLSPFAHVVRIRGERSVLYMLYWRLSAAHIGRGLPTIRRFFAPPTTPHQAGGPAIPVGRGCADYYKLGRNPKSENSQRGAGHIMCRFWSPFRRAVGVGGGAYYVRVLESLPESRWRGAEYHSTGEPLAWGRISLYRRAVGVGRMGGAEYHSTGEPLM